MKHLRPITFVALLAAIIGMSSCAETEIAQLQGKWELFFLNNLADPDIYIYDFQNGGDLVITRYPAIYQDSTFIPTPAIVGQGKYSTTAEFLDAVVVISEVQTTSSNVHVQLSSCCMGENSASWTILKIDDEVLRIGTPDAGGYVIREFVRAE